MTTKENGGPAFPHEGWDIPKEYRLPSPGMSLRDWFAGQVISGSTHRFVNLEHDDQADDEARGIAADAYRLADAMLEARK